MMTNLSISSDELYGLSAYRIYVGLKCHYKTVKFDYTKNRTRTSKKSYCDRSDIRFFEVLSQYKDKTLEDLFVSNFVFNPDLWIGDFVVDKDRCMDRMYARRSYANNYLTSFKSEISTYNESIIRGMRMTEDTWLPGLLNRLLSSKATPDTLVMVDASVGYTWFDSLIKSESKSYNEILVKSCQRLKKHSLFYQVDPELSSKLKEAILDQHKTYDGRRLNHTTHKEQ